MFTPALSLRRLIPAALLAAAVARCQGPIEKDIRELTVADEAVLISALKQNARPPAEYVTERFKRHDVVILGEMHENRDNLEFIAGLIAPLYHRAGVRCLATEFLRHRNTETANRIVTAERYDDAAVLELHRDHGWPWGFKEYMDVFKAVWALNRSLPPDAEKFRIVGLDIPVLAYDLWVETDPERKKEVERAIAGRDRFMADHLLREAERGGKVLLHTGFGHSFTHRRAGSGRESELLGAILRERLGDRVFQIGLHMRDYAPGPNAGPLLHEFLERLFEKAGDTPAGFDVAGSPFAALTCRQRPLFGPEGTGTFAEYTRGYVFLKPVSRLRRITWVDGYVNQEHFERFRYIAERRGWVKPQQCKTPAELDAALKRLFQPDSVPQPVAAKVDAAVFERYTGVYDVSGQSITVTVEGGRLWADIAREGKIELLPESETVFFWRNSADKRVVFAANESGKADRLMIRRANGGETVAKRVSP